jgi:hypothetical protein
MEKVTALEVGTNRSWAAIARAKLAVLLMPNIVLTFREPPTLAAQPKGLFTGPE